MVFPEAQLVGVVAVAEVIQKPPPEHLVFEEGGDVELGLVAVGVHFFQLFLEFDDVLLPRLLGGPQGAWEGLEEYGLHLVGGETVAFGDEAGEHLQAEGEEDPGHLQRVVRQGGVAVLHEEVQHPEGRHHGENVSFVHP